MVALSYLSALARCWNEWFVEGKIFVVHLHYVCRAPSIADVPACGVGGLRQIARQNALQ
jgi:hypothetical protein